jgi:hypothetical protein
LTRITQSLYHRLRNSEVLNRSAAQEAKCEKTGGHPEADMSQIHLLEALDWLMRAQDVIPYGGLSRGYSFGWNPFYPRRGWQPADPKPTAEAIFSLFDCAVVMSRIDLRQRAVDLADWLAKIQMYSGAIRGGALNEAPSSEMCTTALTVLGWIRTAKETGRKQYLPAIRQAADFLLDQQRKATKPGRQASGTTGQGNIPAISAVGLALVQTGIFLEEYTCCAVGERCLNRAISLQQDNGWFCHNGCDRSHSALLQSLSATVESILLGGIILDNSKYIRSARLTADVLLKKFQDDRVLSGRFLSDWSEDVPWSGQLGNAKMAAIWTRLYQITDVDDYLVAARRMIDALKRGQNRSSTNPGLRGGIKGSFPCDGDFGRYQTLSSATIQFINALLLVNRMTGEQTPMLTDAAPVEV